MRRLPFAAAAFAIFLTVSPLSAAPVQGWLNWRGPTQDSVSLEKGLPTKVDAKAPLWIADFPGQSTPVIAAGRLFINGYIGEGSDLQESLRCYDADTGRLIWEHRENDFLSDIVYYRYATSAPTIDPETGNVYVQSGQGIFAGYTADGQQLWRHSMMEEFGRLTFPNSRTASPVVDQDLVITRGITSSWGAHGPAGDRFYAFDKKSGELVWSSAPADRPQDNTFSNPYLDFWGGKRVLYSAGGDSSIFALNVRTGEPLWRFPFAKSGAKGGVNASLVKQGNNLIGVHESENIDSSEMGRLAAFRIPSPGEVKPTNATTPHVFGPKTFEVWRQPKVGSLASSPLVVGDVIYEVAGGGSLCAVQVTDGKVLWEKKLGIEQRQSTPFYADGILYVAMYVAAKGSGSGPAADPEASGSGDLYVLRPGADGAEEISHTTLTGRCLGSPVGYDGKLYLQTDKKLYAFGSKGHNPGLAAAAAEKPWPAPGPAKQLQIIPYEILLKPGQPQAFRVRSLDANGLVVDEHVDVKAVKWETFIPPTALVKSTMKGAFDAAGRLVADMSPVPSAGQFKATLKLPSGEEIVGFIKGRIMPDLPLKQDFEAFELSNTTTNNVEPPTAFAYPPLPWNSARFRFEVREKEVDGVKTKALVKTIENKLFQRAQIFFGHPDMKNYTIEADVLTEGNRRKMSEVGLINQRYAIILKGNSQEIEVNSNQERIKVAAPFKWSPNAWYHLKASVEVAPDGSGMIRGKAWKKGDAEPAEWNIVVPHRHAHPEGSPGIFAFSPQDQRVAIDNISVTAN